MIPTQSAALWENSRRLSQRFMESPRHVFIDQDALARMAEEMKAQANEGPWGPPRLGAFELTVEQTVVYELMASAVNYCYWYGLPSIRPNEASATRMYQLLDVACEAWVAGTTPCMPGRPELTPVGRMLWHFVSLMAENQFPLMAERTRHVLELEAAIGVLPGMITEAASVLPGQPVLDGLFRTLVRTCPGFAEDPFLKRALLFFMQLNRRLGWFAEEILHLPIPADYQVPRVLRDRGVLRFSESLACKVGGFELIPPGSVEECEIRAASILACEAIAAKAGCRPSDVDLYSWTIRNTCKDPFHLTVTPNY